MRSNKKYTNLNFTKRVDHEPGHTTDKRETEPAICTKCEAVYTKGRWTFDKSALGTDMFDRVEPAERICPGCKRVREGDPGGFVYIRGDFFKKHREEIENLLRNEEARMAETNPLARSIKWKKENGGLTITTTTEHLAQHFGRSLKRAYSGDVRYDFSHENKLARVYWEREN